MSEWKTIDSAPKDGAKILASAVGDGWSAYNIVWWRWHKNGKTGSWHTTGSTWLPTHWMPLPAPPEADQP